MEIQAVRVGVDGPQGPLLRPTSIRFRGGERHLVAGEPGTGHTAFALALAGQLVPNTGDVLLDGRPNPTELRRRVAVIDAPQVSEPEDGLRLSVMVGEELALAGEPASRRSVRSWLAMHEATEFADSRLHTVPARVRTRLLVALAASRPDVQVLILDCPDRHTDDARTWWDLAAEYAERGFAVLVLCGNSSARLLGVSITVLGQDVPAVEAPAAGAPAIAVPAIAVPAIAVPAIDQQETTP